MIAHFAILEADFQRDYGINLAADVWQMSWRRFMALARGLSSTSRWAGLIRVEANKPKVITGGEVDAYFASLGGS